MAAADERAEVDRAAAERLTFFSDAVVAIAITLLALDLPVPQGRTSAEVLASLREHSFDYLAFLISFIVIAAHWRAHHRVFRYVVRADRPVIGLNLLWLLFVVLTPFFTRMLIEGEPDFVRFTLYALAQAAQMCTFAVIVAVLSRRGWFGPSMPRGYRERGWVGSLVGAAGFLLSIPLYPLIGTWAFAVWAIVPNLGGRLLRRAGIVSDE
jgi:uncharacterized membrane protein